MGLEVHGLDNHNQYYDLRLKESRKKILTGYKNFTFFQLDLNDKQGITSIFSDHSYRKVIHLAAQAGVRYSIVNPYTYAESNLSGFLNILEACRTFTPDLLIFASSSSVYGDSKKFPLSETDPTDNPTSLYAATKKSNELMAHSYSNLYKFPSVGLRFFTVYGPYGRPDMAYFSFTKAILENKPIKVFNEGDMYRDFTYIDDIVDGIVRILESDTKFSQSNFFFDLYNIGSGNPVKLIDFIEILQLKLGKKANLILENMQPGDVYKTFADTTKLSKETGFKVQTSIEEGMSDFVDWYLNFYK